MVNNLKFLLRYSQELKDVVVSGSEADGVTQSEWIRQAIMEKFYRHDGLSGVSYESAESPNTPNAAKKVKDAWWL
jgi:hypothetical protein